MVQPNVPLSAPQTNVPIVNAGLKYVNGLQITWVDDTHLVVVPGAARDSMNVNDIVLSQSVDSMGVPIFSGALPVGALINGDFVGANGVDQAIIAPNSLYAVYVIGDSNAYKPTACLLSLNYSEPALPVGYDMFRRIGWVSTDITASPDTVFRKWYQFGEGESRDFHFESTITMVSGGTSAVYAAVPVAVGITPTAGWPGVPPILTEALVNIQFTSVGATDSLNIFPYDASLVGAGAPRGTIIISNGAAAETAFTTTLIPLGLAGATPTVAGVPNFLYRVTAGASVTIYLAGFQDFLG